MKNFTDIQTVPWVNGPAAVNTKTGVLYINEPEFQRLGENSRRFVILHELGHINSESKGEKAADEWAMEHLLGLGESSIEMLKAFYEALPFTDYEQRDRAETLLRKVFETEFLNGNEKAKSVLDIFNSIMPGDEDLKHFNRTGKLLQISGRIGQAVGGVLTAIPVTTAIGAAVTAAGTAQVAAGKNQQTKFETKQAEGQEIEQYLAQLEEMAKTMDKVEEVNQKAEELNQEQKQSSDKFPIGIVIVAVVVVALVFYLLKD